MKNEFIKEIEILKQTQPEMRIDLKNQISHLEKTEQSLTNKIYQMENRIIRLEDKVEELDH